MVAAWDCYWLNLSHAGMFGPVVLIADDVVIIIIIIIIIIMCCCSKFEALWTPIPTKTPTIAPSAAPTETPSAAPSVSQEPTQSMQPTISGAPTNIETQSPTSERLRQFLEGAANIPIQSRVSNSTVSELWESEASGAFGTGPSFCASVASVVLFCATWACLL